MPTPYVTHERTELGIIRARLVVAESTRNKPAAAPAIRIHPPPHQPCCDMGGCVCLRPACGNIRSVSCELCPLPPGQRQLAPPAGPLAQMVSLLFLRRACGAPSTGASLALALWSTSSYRYNQERANMRRVAECSIHGTGQTSRVRTCYRASLVLQPGHAWRSQPSR